MTKEQEKSFLNVLYRVSLELRLIGYKGETNKGLSKDDAILIADYADAIHNIPLLLKTDTSEDVDFLVNILKGCNTKKHGKYMDLYSVYLNDLSSE